MRQELRVNPRLYQAMDMLYMPMMDLQQHLKNEILVNPFLELAEDEAEDMPEQPTAEQEKEKKDKEDEVDWEEILLNGWDVGGRREEHEELEWAEPVSVDRKGLDDHLREQLRLLELTPKQLLLAEEFLGNLGDDGYLQASLEEIVASANGLVAKFHEQQEARRRGPAAPAAPPVHDPYADLHDDEDGADEDVPAWGGAFLDESVGPVMIGAPMVAPPAQPEASVDLSAIPPEALYTMAEAEEMLRIMQTLDPAGIAARDLRECLILQLREAKMEDTLVFRLVTENFADLLAHRWNDLAKRYAVEPAAVQAAADSLARFDPKPGHKYSDRGDTYVIPDLVVEKIGDRYHVYLNDSGIPRLRLSRSYQDVAKDRRQMTPENRDFIAQKLNSANWMIQAIEQRRQTMLKVMNFIVDRQREFFEKGVEYLKPLTLREVAEVINMHESTVSRVTNEKFVQTPRGVLPLKFFFSSALSTASGEDASARSIRAKLQKMVGDEDPAKPLTDQQIVHLFQEQGIQIARRTVAKYRDQLSILPARMRKRV
jgi:RNA polymerase sigma-54 factor